MSTPVKLLLSAAFVVVAAFATWFLIPPRLRDFTVDGDKPQVQTVSWQLLQQLDYRSGQAPQKLKELHGQQVRIPGFIVPLSDRVAVLKEFLLVPDPQSCIHVPPPPPNLIVYVKLRKAVPYRDAFNPAWVKGILRIFKTKSQFGYASYRLDGEHIRKYRQ